MIKKCNICNVEYPLSKEYFHVHKRMKNGFYNFCKSCKKEMDFKYANTENGYLTNAYNNMCKRINSKRHSHLSMELRNQFYKVSVTKKEFIELWEKHKQERGYRCHLTGVNMVCKRAATSEKIGYNGYSNGMSVDRLNPKKGYTKENIIFITNEVNKDKSSVTKQICEAIIRLHKERNL